MPDHNVKRVPKQDVDNDKGNEYKITLYNDNVNTFDYVIDCLMSICNHTHEQATQCALITHIKGKCIIKKGEKEVLARMNKQLIIKGLKSILS